MLRISRIDAPGSLLHIIIRGIERRKVFLDDTDRVCALMKTEPSEIWKVGIVHKRIAA